MSEENSNAAKAAWAQAKEVGFGSRVAHTLGCLFIGTPASLKMPSDFYYLQHDRPLPAPNDFSFEIAQRNIFVNAFRRILMRKLAVWVLALGIIAAVLNGVGSIAISEIDKKAQEYKAEKERQEWIEKNRPNSQYQR